MENTLESVQGVPQGFPQEPVWVPHVTWEELEAGAREKWGDFKNLSDEQLKRLFDLKNEIALKKQHYPWLFYRPYEARHKPGYFPQLEFHKSQAKSRLLVGGNRTGKTEGGAMELIWAALGTHPFYKYPANGDYWVVSLTNQMSTEVAEQKVMKWLPRSSVLRYDNKYKVISLKNGSHIGFKSCEQEINTFGGTAKDGIWFDEEPPGERGFQIYKECRMRLIDRGGRMWMTMTPVQGMSWTADEIYEPALAGDKAYFVVQMSTFDNPHLKEEEIREIERDCTEDEKEMRFEGKYIQFAGLVYREFDPAVHKVRPFVIPSHWKRYRTIDHGINNPTACLWVAVDEKDNFYVYDEYYETDHTIKENAEAIRTITGGDRIAWTTIDPSTDNRDPITNTSVRQEYYRHGVTTKALRADRMEGINAVKQLLKYDRLNSESRPRLYIFDKCYNVLREIQRYRWKVYRGKDDKNASEEPQKIHDHAMDALRYLVMSRPRYLLEDEQGYPEEQVWYR